MIKHSKNSCSIYHGPVNIAGIGGYLSSYQRNCGFKSDFVTLQDYTMRQNHDFNLDLGLNESRFKRNWLRFIWFLYAIVRYKIFNFYYAKTLLPFSLDLPILKLFGKKIVMTYCGDDIRLYSVQKEINKYFSLLPYDESGDNRKKLMMRWQNLWCDKFVVARNLVEYAKTTIPKKKLVTNTWVHNLGFNTANCPSIESITTHKVPILVHAPSEQIIKGTKYVRRAINVLKKRGLVFEYKELIGMPNVEAQEVYKNSDVIIDQFLLGDIGTLAFEGMGYGKPVVSYVFQSVIDEHMPDCPVWNSNIDDLADRLEEIVLNPELRVSLGAEGVRFVKRHVDYESINRAIIDLYSSL